MGTSSVSSDGSTVVSLAFWMDLRGYGAMLNKSGFDPTCPDAKLAIERLRRFQETIASHSQTTFPTLVINDGAVAYRDVGLTVTDRAWPFIRRCWNLYQATTEADRQFKGDGLRGVLATGLRARGSNRGILAQNGAVAEIINDLADGRITKDEAVRAASRVRRINDIVPQLQANFAFARAYTAEQGGSKGRLIGSRFYLETRLLRDGVPSWMIAGDPIHWEPKAEWLSALSSTFVEVQAIDVAATGQEKAICTGREMLTSLRRKLAPP
jgi:hypothetical protein